MSCPDSQIFREDKSFISGDMGDVLGKESDDAEGDEVLQEFKDCTVLREEADGAPSIEEIVNHDGIDEDSEIVMLQNNYTDKHTSCEESGADDNEQLIQQNFNGSLNQSSQLCTCDSCKNRLAIDADSVEEVKMAQSHWMELRQYIRSVYRMAMEGSTSPVQPYQPHIKELVHRLCNRNPHLLFQRLEAQVQEFVIEAKVRQLELLHREKQTPQLSKMFLTGLLDSYKKLMSAATQLGPLLEQLQVVHLDKFNVTWKVLNQHLYQSCVYTDPLVQNNVPRFISELSKCCDENAETNKKLVHDFLSFDDEITLVGGMWRDAETRIHQYNQEQATLKAKERMLKEDWKLFKEQRKLFQQKMWNKTISEICDSDGESEDINVTGHRGCPCDECAMTHIFCGGLVTPPHSPGLPSYTNHKMIVDAVKTDSEVQEVGATATEVSSCECHVCTAPPLNLDNTCDTSSGVIVNTSHGGSSVTHHTLHSTSGARPGCGGGGSSGGGGGFHLYPHIHGTAGGSGSGTASTNINVGSSVYPHLYNIHTTLLQHQNGITNPSVPINGTGIDQSVTTTPQPIVNTTTTITTTTVVNDHKQVTTDCDVSHNNFSSSGVPSKSVNITRPGTPPPPSPRPLGVLNYNTNANANNSNGTTAPINMAKRLAQHNNTNINVSAHHHHHQQQQRTHRHSTTQTTPQPSATHPNVNGSSPSAVSTASPASALSTSNHHPHHSNNIPGHSRLHQHQPSEQHNHNKVSQGGNGMPHSCHKHAEPIRRVSTTDPHAADDDDSASPEDSCSERSTSTQRDSRHCDCCYCEVFGHGVPSVAPVSRNYQEMRERLRQLLTKKKAKCKAGNANNSANSNSSHYNSNSNTNNNNNSSSSSATMHTSSSSSLTSSMSSSSSSSSSLSSTKMTSNSAPLTNGMVANPATSNSSSSTIVDVQKDPRDLEDLLDFIEGNPNGKCKDAKKAAKKARQKQKKQEEIDRKKREEEEAERRKQELLIQQQKQQAALLKKQQQQQKQKKKDKGKKNNNSHKNNNNNNLNDSNSANSNNTGTGNGPQMVTIKRVMEPNSAEPTVTITLRGATPSEDKVLYTLLNGQVCQVQKETKNSKGKQSAMNGNNKGKNNNSNNNNNNNYHNKNTVQQQNNNNKKNCSNSNNININNFSNNNNKSLKKETSNTVHIQMNGHANNQHIDSNNSVQLSTSNKKSSKSVRNGNINTQVSHHMTTQVPNPAASPQLTSPTAIQINNAINRLSSSKPNMTNFNLDNLKLPPGITITKVDPATVQQRRPPAQTRQQVASSGVGSAAPAPPPTIAPPKPAASNVIVVDTGRLKDLTALQHNEFNGNVDDLSNNTTGKKKKKNKKGNLSGNNDGTLNNSNRNDVANIISGGGNVTLVNSAQPQPQNGKLVMPQAAAIIKVNGSMVTIRSPALQHALANKTEAVTVVNNSVATANDQNKKRRKKKKGANGQGPADEWNLVDSVFAPKDIDLDNGDIDDAERELEAFKRFCLQSVPPKQKEKVHLNIKDIVLKKKASAISCS